MLIDISESGYGISGGNFASGVKLARKAIVLHDKINGEKVQWVIGQFPGSTCVYATPLRIKSDE